MLSTRCTPWAACSAAGAPAYQLSSQTVRPTGTPRTGTGTGVRAPA